MERGGESPTALTVLKHGPSCAPALWISTMGLSVAVLNLLVAGPLHILKDYVGPQRVFVDGSFVNQHLPYSKLNTQNVILIKIKAHILLASRAMMSSYIRSRKFHCALMRQ